MTSSRVLWICLIVSICLLKSATSAPLAVEDEDEDEAVNNVDIDGPIDKKIRFEDDNPDILGEVDEDDDEEEGAGDKLLDDGEEISVEEIDEEILKEDEAKADEDLPPEDEEILKEEIDDEASGDDKDLTHVDEEVPVKDEDDFIFKEGTNPEEEEEPGYFKKVYRKVKQFLGIAK